MLDSMARAFFVSAWAQACEENDLNELPAPNFSGMELTDIAPDTPDDAQAYDECLNREPVPSRGGAEYERYIGAWLENNLTSDGIDYVREAIKESLDKYGNHTNGVAELWAEYYSDCDVEPRYEVIHRAHCGMVTEEDTGLGKKEAREVAASLLRRYRKEFDVTTLDPGNAWEVLEPENCAMVPDACGVISINQENEQ